MADYYLALSYVNDVSALKLRLQFSIFETKHFVERGQLRDLDPKLVDFCPINTIFSPLFLELVVLHIPLHAARSALPESNVFGSFGVVIVNKGR